MSRSQLPRRSGVIANNRYSRAEAAILNEARRRQLDRPAEPLRRPTLPGDDIYLQSLPLRSIPSDEVPFLIDYASRFRLNQQEKEKPLPPMTDNVINALHWARRKDEDFRFTEADEAFFKAVDDEFTQDYPEAFNPGERHANIPRIFGWEGYEVPKFISVASKDLPDISDFALSFADEGAGALPHGHPIEQLASRLDEAVKAGRGYDLSDADVGALGDAINWLEKNDPKALEGHDTLQQIVKGFAPKPAPAAGNVLYQSLPPETKAQVDAVVETINRHAAPAASAPPPSPPPPPPPPPTPPSDGPGGFHGAGRRLLSAIDSPTGWEVLAGALASGLFVAPSLLAAQEDPREEGLKLALAMGGGIGGGLAAGRLGRRIGGHFRPNDSHYGTAAEIGGHMIGDGAGVLLGTALGGAMADAFGWDPRLPAP